MSLKLLRSTFFNKREEHHTVPFSSNKQVGNIRREASQLFLVSLYTLLIQETSYDLFS